MFSVGAEALETHLVTSNAFSVALLMCMWHRGGFVNRHAPRCWLREVVPDQHERRFQPDAYVHDVRGQGVPIPATVDSRQLFDPVPISFSLANVPKSVPNGHENGPQACA